MAVKPHQSYFTFSSRMLLAHLSGAAGQIAARLLLAPRHGFMSYRVL